MQSEVENHVTDLLPAFALDALTDDETNQVVTHPAGCSTCQDELARLQLVADELPLALAQVSPSSAVKTRLMSAIRERQGVSPASARPTFWQKLAQSLWRPLPALGIVLIVILALGNLILWRQLSGSNPQAVNSMRVVALANTENSPGAVGTLVMDPRGHYGTLVVDNLAPLSPGQQYQVWLTKGDSRTSGGLFSVNYEGYASLEITAPLPLASYDAIGISIEPSGGSADPTGLRVMGVDLLK
jgi:anti-sigma-K factor RskA